MREMAADQFYSSVNLLTNQRDKRTPAALGAAQGYLGCRACLWPACQWTPGNPAGWRTVSPMPVPARTSWARDPGPSEPKWGLEQQIRGFPDGQGREDAVDIWNDCGK